MFNEYKPLVSIIIPVFNGGNFLAQAIDCAIEQTYENIEIIVVNDGSTDNGETEKIALSYGNKIRYFYKENGGCASALNYGISEMRGEWFSWLSHDDLYLPEKIEKELECIAKNSLDPNNTIIACSTYIIDENGNILFYPKKVKNHFYSNVEIYRYFFSKGTLNGCGLLIPKKAFDVVGGFNTKHKYKLDWEQWIKFALSGFSFYTLENKLVKNRVHNQQVTVRQASLYIEETKDFIRSLSMQLVAQKYNVVYVKPLYFYCCSMGLKNEAYMLKQYLKNDKQFSIFDILKSKIVFYKRTVLRLAKKLYQRIIRR